MNVYADVTGSVWKLECSVGQFVEEGDTLAILESMKMEIPVESEATGRVASVLCSEGQPVNEGDLLLTIEQE